MDEDVAKLATIPVASVDFTPLEIGTPVIITRFGCDSGADKPSKAPSHLKYSSTKTVEVPWERYIATPGIPRGASASTCPGDSGSLIYGGNATGTAARIVAAH